MAKKKEVKPDPKCKDLVHSHLRSRIEEFEILWANYKEDPEKSDDDYGNMYEFGLSFDYEAPDERIKEGYFRYQLSWGGPSDEFRFFTNLNYKCYRIEYWYMDWFDGAKVELEGKDFDLMEEIFMDFFVESETAKCKFEEAMKV